VRSSLPVAPQKDSSSEKPPETREALDESNVEPAPLAITPPAHSGRFGDDYVPRPLL